MGQTIESIILLATSYIELVTYVPPAEQSESISDNPSWHYQQIVKEDSLLPETKGQHCFFFLSKPIYHFIVYNFKSKNKSDIRCFPNLIFWK